MFSMFPMFAFFMSTFFVMSFMAFFTALFVMTRFGALLRALTLTMFAYGILMVDQTGIPPFTPLISLLHVGKRARRKAAFLVITLTTVHTLPSWNAFHVFHACLFYVRAFYEKLCAPFYRLFCDDQIWHPFSNPFCDCVCLSNRGSYFTQLFVKLLVTFLFSVLCTFSIHLN